MGSIALVVGELTAFLNVDNDAYKRGLREARGDLTRFGADTGRDTDKIGRDTGGKLAQGMRQGFIRNSPLIVAAVGGALTAGAPAVLAGATGLFAGIGIAAATQSIAVRSAWRDTWEHVRDDTVDASAPIQEVMIGLADRVSDRFDDLRPQLAGAFDDLAPQIDVFADGVMGLVDNALPGLFRAIERGMPVTEGLANFLEDTGTGISGFFDGISDHGGAAGDVLDQLGDSMETLLPLVGEVLGQGAELASDVLPLLNGALGLTLKITEGLGPALPVVAEGFIAFKTAQAASRFLDGFAGSLQTISTRTGIAEGGVGRFGRTMRGVGNSLPIVGTAILGITEAFTAAGEESEANAAKIGTLYDAIRSGGSAAEGAQATLAVLQEQAKTSDLLARDMDKAEAANRRYWDSLSPIEQAQSKVAEWTNTLSTRLEDENATTEEVNIAKERLAYWADVEARRQGEVEDATRSVTEAMVEQADQAMAAIDSGFAYRRSTDQLEDAQARLEETIKNRTNADKDLRTTEEDVRRAQLDVEESTMQSAKAYGRQQADLTGLDKKSSEYAATLDRETLKELYRLRKAAGPDMKDAIQTQIDALERAGVKLDTTGAKTDDAAKAQQNLRTRIIQLPDGKNIAITAPTKMARIDADLLQRKINGLKGRTINITASVSASLKSILGGFGLNWIGRGLSEGGFTGPGGKYEPAGVVHKGEVVWSQDDIRAHGGVDAVERARRSRPRGYANGGPVGVVTNFDDRKAAADIRSFNGQLRKLLEPGTGLVAALQFARSQVGKPYIWGAAGPSGYDCSGFMSALTNVARGRSPYSRLGATSTFPWSGFAPGYGQFTIGSTKNAYGSGIGHMAGTLLGVNVESTGGVGVRVGASARGASNSLFGTRAHLAMYGGGVIREPVVGLGMTSGRSYSFGERGAETVTPGEPRSRAVTINIYGVDFTKRSDKRQVAQEIHRELVSIERARS